MGWKATSVVEERHRFIQEWERKEECVAELCRRYGVSRQTGYKWIRRYEQGGKEELGDRSRAPHSHPNEVIPEVVDEVLALRGEHPRWGPEKLRGRLQREAPEIQWPAPSTIGEMLKRNGLVIPRRKRSHATPSSGPLAHATEPNIVWCTDFKGWWVCGDGSRCYPLTLTDACSRYLLRCQVMPDQQGWRARPVYEAAFREYGLPNRMRNDNGAPFATAGLAGLSRLSVWWIKLGIVPERIQPGKPAQNGRHERMHLTLKQETHPIPAASLRAQQKALDEFRCCYNEQRPHAALQQKTPGECYRCSPRTYPSHMPEVEYPAGFAVRRVDQNGQFRWRAVNVYTNRALGGECVGLEAIAEDRWRVYFSFYEIGELRAGDEAVRRAKPPSHEQDDDTAKGNET